MDYFKVVTSIVSILVFCQTLFLKVKKENSNDNSRLRTSLLMYIQHYKLVTKRDKLRIPQAHFSVFFCISMETCHQTRVFPQL